MCGRVIQSSRVSEPADAQSLFAKAFAAAPVSLTITSLVSGRLLQVNDTFVTITGYSREEAVGRTTVELGLWADTADREAELAMVASSGSLRNLEYRFRARDGRLIIGLLSAERLDIAGEPCALTLIQDITAAKQSESELRLLQQRLSAVASATSSILASPEPGAVTTATIAVARDVFSADGYAVWRFDESSGWRVVESHGISETFTSRFIALNVGRRVRGELEFSEPLIIDDVAAAPLLKDLRDAYAAEGIVSMVVFPLGIRGHRTGTIVFYFRQPRRFTDADIEAGRALANIAAAALATAELYAEQEAARQAATYAQRQAAFLAEAGAVLSSSLDYQSTLRSVARLAVPTIADWCAVDMVGSGGVERLAVAHVDPDKVASAIELQKRYPADPNAPGGVHDVIRTGKPARVARIRQAALEGAARDDEHLRIIRRLAITSYMCVPLFDRGRPAGAITFVSAESGREYSDDDLRFARELAARASLAIENARTYAEAADANRLKDEFLATLSHELRTPLNAILGYARMLRSGIVAAEKTPAALDIVERNAASLNRLIEDVLDVSRIISGRIRLAIEPVDLPAVVRAAIATVQPAADAKGVAVETAVDAATPPLPADQGRLQQLIWNLLANAIKFTPSGGRVRVHVASAGGQIELAVSDTGIGISPEFLPYVFDRFRQGDASFAREHGGLGLGLAIARHIAELHGGTIRAESAGVGRGATFTVSMPMRAGQSAPAPPPPYPDLAAADAAVDRSTPRARLDGIHVLAVDDEPEALDLVRTVLEAAGARVTAVNSANAALDQLGRGGVDVLIADVGMPQVDGLELIRRVRQLPVSARSTPAAAVTAYARSDDRILTIASGFQMHLAKPIDPDGLVAAVAALHAERTLPSRTLP